MVTDGQTDELTFAAHARRGLMIETWICKTCDRSLVRGSMPLQAKTNGLQLCYIPPVLSGLNALELRLISLHVATVHENGSIAIW